MQDTVNNGESRYLRLLSKVLDEGNETLDRTGVGTKSIFGPQVSYETSKEFPLFTTKKIFWKGVVLELLWILQGQTNIKWLVDHKVNIWNEWANEDGDLGPVYGHVWRNFGGDYKLKTQGIDQIRELISLIKKDPNSRRLIVSAWDPSIVKLQALPPCHTLFQFKAYGDKLHCKLYQRSADLFLGVPFNTASYSLLLSLIANECGLKAGEFIHTFGDCHIYNNHIDAVKKQLSRLPFKGPRLRINLEAGNLIEFIEKSKLMTWEEISKIIILEEYSYHPSIKAEVAV